MKVNGTYTVPVPKERAYALLQDPSVLAQCMPGCDRLEQTGEDSYQMKMKMAIAAVSGQFDGKIRILDKVQPHQFKLVVEGNGKIGFLKGEGVLQLADAEAGETNVSYEGDVQVGGTIAAVGQRLLDTTSKLMIKRFFDKFSEVSRT